MQIKTTKKRKLLSNRPFTLRLTHTEISRETALDFMVEGITKSPLTDEAREHCQQASDAIEETTTRGFRIKLII